MTSQAPSPTPEESAPEALAVDLESDVDAAIAACGGDMRATVRALLVANSHLVREVEQIKAAVSHGYARGMITRLVRPRGPERS